MSHEGHDHAHMTTLLASSTAKSDVMASADDHSSHSVDSNGGGHSMLFHFGSAETILFGFWNINSVAGLIMSWIIIFFIAIFYEALKWYRMHLAKNTKSNSVRARDVEGKPVATVETPLKPKNNRTNKYSDLMRYAHTALNAFQMFLGYLLMLIFMTFNVWLCSAVIIGDAVGYFFFVGKPNGDGEDNHATCH